MEFFMVGCRHPNVVKFEVNRTEGIGDIPNYQKTVIKTCPRNAEKIEVSIEASFGVVTSVSCKHIECPFNAGYVGQGDALPV